MKTLMIAALLLVPMYGCQTSETDVEQTEADAELQTNRAYDHADEVAIQAQYEADEKSDQIIAEAQARVAAIQQAAQERIDAAYDNAERTETVEAQRTAEVRRKDFVYRMTAQLNQTKADLRALEEQRRQQKEAAAGSSYGIRLDAAGTAVDQATAELAKVRKASLDQWEHSAMNVERYVAVADQNLADVQSVRNLAH